jgi:hypothetical protein
MLAKEKFACDEACNFVPTMMNVHGGQVDGTLKRGTKWRCGAWRANATPGLCEQEETALVRCVAVFMFATLQEGMDVRFAQEVYQDTHTY